MRAATVWIDRCPAVRLAVESSTDSVRWWLPVNGGDGRMPAGTPEAPGARRDVRVVLVDQHDVIRRGMRGVLSAVPGIRVVGEATGVGQALRQVVDLSPDVVVTDVRLPDGTAADVCRQTRAARPSARVIVVTPCTEPDQVYQAILAGACAYLLDDITGDTLVDAVHRVAAGQCMLDPVVTGRVLDRLRHPAARPPEAGHPELAALTDQEHRILDLIVDGLTNREIGAALRVSEQTVKNHVTSILAKLGVSRRTQAAALGARLRRRAALHPGAAGVWGVTGSA